MRSTTTENCTIFSALHEAITARDKKQLKFAKCHKCGLLTSYRLQFLKDDGLRCKKCGNHISIRNK